MAGKRGRDATMFQRWPRTTLVSFFLVVSIALDLSAGVFFIPPDENAFRSIELTYHHALLPLANARTRWGDTTYRFSTNSLGFRDASARRVDPRAPGRRILLIGDSFVEGMGVEWEQSVAGLLDGWARERGAEVLNAGMVSYSPKLYYLKVRHLLEVRRLRFDDLFVFIDISDILDELLYESFEPDRAGWLTEAAYGLDRLEKRRSFVWWSLRTLAQRRSADPMMAAATVFWLNSVKDKQLLSGSFARGRAMWTVDPVVFEQWGRRGLALAQANMDALAKLCASRGVRLTVVVYPWREQIALQDLDSVQVRAWRSFAAAHGAGFLDLFPMFINGTDPDEVISASFIPRDTHWNAEGNRRVAEGLRASLGW